ncbi:MAG: NusG domain II-containing protein [Christensenellales bacterium]|jgi:hypothetical protein
MKFGDIIIGLIVIAAAVLLLITFQTRSCLELIAVVIKEDQEIHKIDLDGITEQTTIILEGTDIVIVAEKRRIRFVESSCHDKTCINTGWLDSVGDIAACLPNRVLIKIVGEESARTGEIDIIAQ